MIFLPPLLNGLALSAGLIMAIGAQNAYVLRAGITRQHVALTVTVCVLIDIVLICLGVAGIGAAVQNSPLLLGTARWGGAAFLLWYGLRSWRAVFADAGLSSGAPMRAVSRRQALVSVLAISLLNPHLYLDTLILLGAIGGNFPLAERPSFVLGACIASTLWFCSVGFAARRLAGVFARPMAWKCIDALTGSMMLTLAGSVAFGN